VLTVNELAACWLVRIVVIV